MTTECTRCSRCGGWSRTTGPFAVSTGRPRCRDAAECKARQRRAVQEADAMKRQFPGALLSFGPLYELRRKGYGDEEIQA